MMMTPVNGDDVLYGWVIVLIVGNISFAQNT